MTVRASIDLGTNTCLLLVVEWNAGKISRVLGDFATVVRLGERVDLTHRIAPAASERTLRCLKEYAVHARKLGADPAHAVCVATSSARDATNSKEFFEEVKKQTGFKFVTISGEQEARLSFQGALLPGMSMDKTVVIDIGGGSTEFVSAQSSVSIDIGSVRLTERHLHSDPVTDQEYWKCTEDIDFQLSKLAKKRPGMQLLGVAGTITTLAAWFLNLPQFDAEKVNQCELSRGDVHRMVEELKWRTIAQRLELPGVEAGREDVLLAGALILWRSMEIFGYETCRVSSRGLRYGLLLARDLSPA